MELTSIRRSLAYAAVGTALGLPAVTADAVVYGSFFDPPDFLGTATFNVSQPCLDAAPPTGGFVDEYTVPGCAISWLSAEVTFRDPNPGDPPFSFSYAALLPTSVEDIFVQGGELFGVNSFPLGPFIIPISNPEPTFRGPWWIEYVFTGPGHGDFDHGIVNLYGGTCGPEFCTRDLAVRETAQVEFFTRVTSIPEPGTFALILSALGGAWLARRRKKPQRPAPGASGNPAAARSSA